MSEQGEGATERPAIDFAQYSTEQLRSELERRRTEESAADSSTSGRFSVHDGLTGWLESRSRGSTLYGSGSIDVGATEVVLRGYRRTWLGAPEQAEVEIPPTAIRNVVHDGEHIRFEYRRRFPWYRPVEFIATSGEGARALAESLPRHTTAGFEKRWSQLRDYNRSVKEVGTKVWVTPTLVVLNVLIFIAMVIVQRRLGGFTPDLPARWGANIGLLTLGGQWWRLVTALFLHANLMHLLLNMWAFWTVGRMTERLYGNGTLLFLYLGSGVIANLTTLLWEPTHGSIGASGAIFGVFGAFLAFLVHEKTKVPATVMRAHWFSTAAFVGFNLVEGALEPGVDNAAHVGGLLAGFALGWILARPVDPAEREAFPFRQVLVASGSTALAILSILWHEGGLGDRLSGPEQFLQDHLKYTRDEADNLRRWQGLLTRAAGGRMTYTDTADRFEHDILPFWIAYDARARREARTVPADQRQIAAIVAEVARLRVEWTRAIIGLERQIQPAPEKSPEEFARETDFAVARIERIAMRATLDRRPPALANSAWLTSLRHWFAPDHWRCVYNPEAQARPHDTDSTADGPAARASAGCLAQRLFMTGEYKKLDSLLQHAATSLGDLADGSSTLEGLIGGLDDLFTYGGLDAAQALGRTSDWRRAVPGSVNADLIESAVFESWGWAARGFGAAAEVSPDAWLLFFHRVHLAAAGLEEIQERATTNPTWYSFSLSVGLARNLGVEKLRPVFDAGIEHTPQYRPLYRGMLRILLPRWGGSYEKVDHFIEQMSDRSGSTDRDVEQYARLYWMYDSLERDSINLFDDSLAVWPLMKDGFRRMVKHYPHSDLVLNAFVKFACLSQDAHAYLELRPSIEHRRASAAWSAKTSIEGCDRQFMQPVRPGPEAFP